MHRLVEQDSTRLNVTIQLQTNFHREITGLPTLQAR